MLSFSALLFMALLAVVWIGSGMVVSSIDRIRRRLRMSSFIISFFVLGVLTTIPEMAIGLNAVTRGEPEIFVGNLLGATLIIFLLIIPILAIFGKGIKLNHELGRFSLISILTVVLLPAFFILDKKITVSEGLVLTCSFVFTGFLLQDKFNIFSKKKPKTSAFRKFSMLDLLKMLVGILLIFVASSYIVDNILELSKLISVSPFFISFAVLSIGTNMPEISLAARAIISRKKELAFGSYLGSAATNTFVFGFLSLINNGETVTVSNFVTNFIFITLGVTVFYFFLRSKNDISKKEGWALLGFYLLFMFFELFLKR